MRLPNNGRPDRLPTFIPLALIVLVGLTLRTWNIDFDRGIGSHPDERSTTCFYAPRLAWPGSWDEFADPRRSPLNPLWNLQEQRFEHFTYGHLPLYLGVATGEVLHRLAPVAEKLSLPGHVVRLMDAANRACGGVAVAGRLVIALLDTLTILLLYRLGRRIYGWEAGLAAAAFYAFTAQAVQLSHFFAMDPASTTFAVLAVLGAVMMVQERTWRATLLTGVACGLAVSSKFSALPILLAPAVAVAAVFWQEWRQDRRPEEGTNSGTFFWAILSLPAVLVLALVAFTVTSPYAVLDWKNFIQATLVEQGQMVRGVADFPFTRQYRNTLPYVYFVEQQVRWGLGWPLGLVASLGTLYALGRLLIGRARPGELIVWSWLVPYFGLTGAFLAKFNRYMSPVLPFALLFAAGLIWVLVRGHYLRLAVGYLVLAVGLLGGLFWSVAYVNGVYGREHTWIAASRWVYDNVPEGSVILWELWDDPLPKAIPDEPGMDMGSAGLRHIDWSPYEEDTAEKYAILKAKLREADYVIYSSKRIYDSVDELPERYPMTTRYYRGMFAGELGFELVADVTGPPRLFGLVFPDQGADESWSLYDHPRVTVFQKERSLSDAEFDALLGGSWAGAVPWYRGKDSPISPFLNALGLGSSPESSRSGLINRAIALLTGEKAQPGAEEPDVQKGPSLLLDVPLSELPVVDNYRWNVTASERAWLGAVWWWLVVALLGWLAWPISFVVFRRLRDRGYFLSRTLGWLLAGWILWLLASLHWAQNTVVNAWLTTALLGVAGMVAAVWYWPELRAFVRDNWGLMVAGEALFAVAYVFFVLIRMANPDLWQPWFGGEKFMEFSFLNGILRSPTFPPVDPHFAGGYINYYYFGIYLVAYLVKLTGIYAEVAFNLAIPTLFALTALNGFALAYSAVRVGRVARGEGRGARGELPPATRHSPAASSQQLAANSHPPAEEPADDVLDIDLLAPAPTPSPRHPVFYREGAKDAKVSLLFSRRSSRLGGESSSMADTPSPHPRLSWRIGLVSALIAPLFLVLIGNLDGFAQAVRRLTELSNSRFESAIPGLQTAVRAGSGLWQVLTTDMPWPGYNFWDPSRVIPYTINEFPYWSFLYADLHPHLIGIPFSLLFLGLVLTLLHSYDLEWRRHRPRAALLFGGFALLLGTLASVNLWELPTYFGLGVLTLAVSQYRGRGRIDWPLMLGFALLYPVGAYLLFLPFFRHYVNVGAGGVGLVREPDALGRWLLIWGFFAFVLVSWLLHTGSRPARAGDAVPNGLERWLSLVLGRFESLPGLLHWQGLLVRRPGFGFLAGITLVPLSLVAALGAWLWDRTVLALCLPFLGLAALLLWRRGRTADAGNLFAVLLTATGFAILAGTQLIYLKDFLQGGEWYRMNTLFKFFIQVWVLWGVAAAVAVPRLIGGHRAKIAGVGRYAWHTFFALLLAASFAYPIWGTPVRLDQRFPGWRPGFGTLNGMDFMRQGAYTWPNDQNTVQLAYDWAAIRWLLENVRGNAAILETAQLDYYRAGATRVASLTGLSGLSGMHQSEQRYGQDLGERNGLMQELWSTSDVERTRQLLDEFDVALIYVGQLERHEHPAGVDKLTRMAETGMLTPLYQNERVTIYTVPGRLVKGADGHYYPAQP